MFQKITKDGIEITTALSKAISDFPRCNSEPIIIVLTALVRLLDRNCTCFTCMTKLKRCFLENQRDLLKSTKIKGIIV